jgi:hypothetical protein
VLEIIIAFKVIWTAQSRKIKKRFDQLMACQEPGRISLDIFYEIYFYIWDLNLLDYPGLVSERVNQVLDSVLPTETKRMLLNFNFNSDSMHIYYQCYLNCLSAIVKEFFFNYMVKIGFFKMLMTNQTLYCINQAFNDMYFCIWDRNLDQRTIAQRACQVLNTSTLPDAIKKQLLDSNFSKCNLSPDMSVLEILEEMITVAVKEEDTVSSQGLPASSKRNVASPQHSTEKMSQRFTTTGLS